MWQVCDGGKVDEAKVENKIVIPIQLPRETRRQHTKMTLRVCKHVQIGVLDREAGGLQSDKHQ